MAGPRTIHPESALITRKCLGLLILPRATCLPGGCRSDAVVEGLNEQAIAPVQEELAAQTSADAAADTRSPAGDHPRWLRFRGAALIH